MELLLIPIKSMIIYFWHNIYPLHWFVAHLIGDYALQNDFMAQNKKTSSPHCLLHIATYMIPFLLCGLAWWQLLLIGIQHYLQDRGQFVNWYFKVMGKEKFGAPPCGPWSLFIVDNIFHILFMILVCGQVVIR